MESIAFRLQVGQQVIHGIDCFQGFKKLKNETIDLIVTSPPYNLKGFHADRVIRKYANFEDDMEEDDYRNFIKEVIKESYRVLKRNGNFYLNLKTRIIDGEAIPPYWILEGNPFILKQEIIWKYPSTANVDKVRFYPLFEYVFWFIKDKKNFKFNDEWAIIGNVWEISHIYDRNETKIIVMDKEKGEEVEIKHPAPFPTQLVEAVILSSSYKNDKVLDPFLGSGTTLKVCSRYGRKGIGFEKYFNDYRRIILKRIHSDDFLPSLLEMKMEKLKKKKSEEMAITLDRFIG